MLENTVEWLIEDQVVLTHAYHWDADSLAEDIIRVNEMVKSSDQPLVHTVWEFTNLEKYPANLNAIRKAVQPLFENKQLGWVITIIHNPMITFLAQVATGMYKVRYRSFKDYDEAIQFLESRDSTIVKD